MTDSIEMGATLIDEAEKARREHLAHLHATYETWCAFRVEVTKIANHLKIPIHTRLGPFDGEGILFRDHLIEVDGQQYSEDSPGLIHCSNLEYGVAADEVLAQIATELGKMAAQRDFENPEIAPL